MAHAEEHPAGTPEVDRPRWWSFLFGPATPAEAPSQGPAPGKNPVVVPAPGTDPEPWPDDPDMGFDPGAPGGGDEFDDWSAGVASPAAGGGVFIAVALVVMMFFFAATAASGF